MSIRSIIDAISNNYHARPERLFLKREENYAINSEYWLNAYHKFIVNLQALNRIAFVNYPQIPFAVECLSDYFNYVTIDYLNIHCTNKNKSKYVYDEKMKRVQLLASAAVFATSLYSSKYGLVLDHCKELVVDLIRAKRFFNKKGPFIDRLMHIAIHILQIQMILGKSSRLQLLLGLQVITSLYVTIANCRFKEYLTMGTNATIMMLQAKNLYQRVTKNS